MPTGGWLALHAASGVVAGRSTRSLDVMLRGAVIGMLIGVVMALIAVVVGQTGVTVTLNFLGFL